MVANVSRQRCSSPAARSVPPRASFRLSERRRAASTKPARFFNAAMTAGASSGVGGTTPYTARTSLTRRARSPSLLRALASTPMRAARAATSGGAPAEGTVTGACCGSTGLRLLRTTANTTAATRPDPSEAQGDTSPSMPTTATTAATTNGLSPHFGAGTGGDGGEGAGTFSRTVCSAASASAASARARATACAALAHCSPSLVTPSRRPD
ncbi:unannotated protein [freshwater metagenome]|uniref:Unannotated protein n=1 Tax=freshwater metagenome TaxID=449393 RepID=A0A6J6RS87_9ZZZZ